MKYPLRIISIMSTMKAHNLCVCSMIQKRDFQGGEKGRHVPFLGRGSSQKGPKKGAISRLGLFRGPFRPFVLGGRIEEKHRKAH